MGGHPSKSFLSSVRLSVDNDAWSLLEAGADIDFAEAGAGTGADSDADGGDGEVTGITAPGVGRADNHSGATSLASS